MKSKNLCALFLCFAIIWTSLTMSMMVVNASAPEGWRDLPDFYVFKDNVSGWSGSGAGELETVNGNLPIDSEVTYENLPSLRFNLTRTLTSGWMTVILTLAEWNSHDVSRYVSNGHLEFYVKGENGGEEFLIGAIDNVTERPSGVENKIIKPITDYCTVTTEWQHVKIPLKDILDPSLDMDPYNAKAIVLDRVTENPFCVWINQLKLTSPDKENAFPAIKVNQVGFLESSEKYVFVTGFEDDFNATVGTEFQVKRVSDNSVAYSGQLALVTDFDEYDSGEKVLKAIFTDLKESGLYYITVSADGIDNSPRFKIGNDVYSNLVIDATRYFYYQRANIDLVAPYCTDYPREDKTPQDFNCPFASNPSITKDVSKGWYDAGDPNKYVSTGAEAVSTLLWAYEMFSGIFSDNQNNIPESGNGVPDILDEVRWELEWILKMQDSISGGFYARVTFTDNFTSGQRVIMDKQGDTINIRSTVDTASAVAVLAHASIIYEKYDQVFAQKCLDAAKKGWSFLLQNPNNIKSPDGPYVTDSDECERFWAAATLYRVIGDSSYNNYVKANYMNAGSTLEGARGDWSIPWNNGFFHYMKAQNRSSEIEIWYRDKFAIWTNNTINRYKNNPWGNVIEYGNYYWGSNSIILGLPREALIGSAILGTTSDEIERMALSSLNWILGANPMRKSFVSGYGDDSVKEIFATWSDDGLPGIPKGIMPGGANRYQGAGLSIFPAKCYLESASNFTTNEHTIGWNALLVFMAAFANNIETPKNNQIVGDLNGDGIVNSIDYVLMRRYILEIVSSLPVKDELVAADLNLDGKINSNDYVILKRYLLEQIQKLPHLD
ncbi:UNVERIFIED_CONTAM: dockerin type I repeat protein [Acetivibrio alkalicellulosi]